MILIIGLGNPGKQYQKTRHNLGFRIIEEFLKQNRDRSNFRNFHFEKKFQAEVAEGKFRNQKIILTKPQTFMNNSGKSVKKIIGNCLPRRVANRLLRGKLPARQRLRLLAKSGGEIGNLFVIHDDIYLPLGKIKISKGRGSAGHKGVESIIKELKTRNFIRFRIGIQPKTGKPPKQSFRDATGQAKNAEKFVLRPFNKEEEKIVRNVVKKAVEAIELTVKEGTEKAMTKFN